uniref:Uncharacterized protein n=1 Tax=Arundo donax TaxID=35708 RepID=A0A0A9F3W9_ARUDO
MGMDFAQVPSMEQRTSTTMTSFLMLNHPHCSWRILHMIMSEKCTYLKHTLSQQLRGVLERERSQGRTIPKLPH